MDYLKIAVPPSALVHVGPEFLAANPEDATHHRGKAGPVSPGWHFGSRYPGDPARTAVYDYLPDALLGSVANLADFRAILVFDQWLSNADGRQSIFYRAMVRREHSGGSPAFVARMIDHGFAFNGPQLELHGLPHQGLYPRHSVYDSVRSLEDFEPWLGQIVHFPEEVIDRAWKSMPGEWIGGEEAALEDLLSRLYQRRAEVPHLIARAGNRAPTLSPTGDSPRVMALLVLCSLRCLPHFACMNRLFPTDRSSIGLELLQKAIRIFTAPPIDTKEAECPSYWPTRISAADRLEGTVSVASSVELKTLLLDGDLQRKEPPVDLERAEEVDLTILQLLWAAEREAGKGRRNDQPPVRSGRAIRSDAGLVTIPGSGAPDA